MTTLPLPIQIGTALQLDIPGMPERIHSEFKGMEPGHYFIAAMPEFHGSTDVAVFLRNGNSIVVRYLHEGSVFGFEAEIMGTIFKPVRLVFLRYPEAIQDFNLRAHSRIDCFVPATITVNEIPLEGAVVDMSRGGCRFRMFDPNPEIEETLQAHSGSEVGLHIRYPSDTSPLPLKCTLRRWRRTTDTITAGLVYSALSADVRARIDAHIIGTDAVPQYYDLSIAINEHMIWKSRLRSFLDGHQTLDPQEVTSARECALGRWLYSCGLDKYRAIPEMKALESTHEQLHAGVCKVVEQKRAGNPGTAELEHARVEKLSQEIVAMLVRIEAKIAE
jgi:c-di-GMP-binding flagellar brake protein YcgR